MFFYRLRLLFTNAFLYIFKKTLDLLLTGQQVTILYTRLCITNYCLNLKGSHLHTRGTLAIRFYLPIFNQLQKEEGSMFHVYFFLCSPNIPLIVGRF